jgi:hypothetical protein
MYNQKLAGAILEKLNEMFPTPTSSDDLWEFQVKGFADVAKSEWLVVIDALLGMGQVRGVPLRDGSHLQNAADLKLTGQGREELRRTQATTSFGASSVVRDDLVFLTHATKDQTLAIFLKNLIENSVPGADVFVSSDTEDLRPGDEWVRRIRENLRAARVLLVLASERALARPWVWYEAGSAWSRRIRMIPCCIGKIRKNNLSALFSSYRALNLDEASDFSSLLTELGRELRLEVQLPEVVGIVLELKGLDQKAHAADALAGMSPEEVQLGLTL